MGRHGDGVIFRNVGESSAAFVRHAPGVLLFRRVFLVSVLTHSMASPPCSPSPLFILEDVALNLTALGHRQPFDEAVASPSDQRL
jgi:hypothetical protein